MEQNLNNEFAVRVQKLKDLREAGKIPYAARFERSILANDAIKKGEEGGVREVEEIIKGEAQNVEKLCGRVMTQRAHGKLSFLHLQDFSGKIQICFMQDFIGSEKYKFLKKIDMADFIGVSGELFRTKHGEITLLVSDVVMLSKALRPLPEKHHGLKDQEQIYRQRYLDTVMNRDSFERFLFRSDFVRYLREFYWSEGFLEIESPTLENVSSGTTAKPFTTHHNALDIDMYLRIAGGECWHKMAVLGGYEKVFEIGKCFRNEGKDPSHLQEFTMVEHYAAYWDYEDNMKLIERMFSYLIQKLFGTLKITILDREDNEVEIDFTAPWPRKKFADLILQDSGIDIFANPDAKSLLDEIKKKGIVIDGAEQLGYGNLMDSLYKKVSRPKLIQPCFVIQHPFDLKPLARINDENPKVCDSFQLLVNTWELVNAYGELVDPIDQRKRFEDQAIAIANGDEEAMMINEAYLEAMEHGMPCMSGVGIGIDRLVTLLTKQNNLKDSVLFPLMRPLEEHVKMEKKAMEKARKKAK